jgi:hypothetical protein
VLTPKDLPAPIVNIQSAPTAPAPVGIGAALGVLANADAFRDITGLTQNQLNALSALQSSLKVAESFGKQAAGFVKSQEARRALPRSLEAIKSARDKKLITDEDARELTEQAFQTALGIPPGTSKPVQKQAVKDVVDSAIQSAKSKTTITDQVGDRKQTVTVEKDDGDAAAKIDFQVSGRLRHLKQTKRMDCWAVVATILYSFKYNTESHIEDVLALAGDAYLTAYRDDTGLASAAKADLLTALGLVAAPSNDLDVTRLEQLLRERGPLWVTADEDPTARFSVHARVVIGLRGDGTLTGTVAFYLDTTPGTPASPRSETVAELREKLTQLAAGDAASGSFRPQIVHF